MSIALEPEAASLYCQLLPTEKIHGTEGAKFAVASPGSKYMVIDLGGMWNFETQYRNDPKFLDRSIGLANNADPNQTAPIGAV